ncbi:MAG: alpha-hydroxy acid oxidase [Patulibacter sp.]
MTDVLRLLASQVAEDLRGLPRRGRAADRRVARAGSIDEIRAAARASLPKVIFEFVDGGANDERTVRRNLADFDEIALLPRTLVDVSGVDTATTVLGQEIAAPIIGAPTGLCGLIHHDGEVGLAQAMHGAGSIYTLAAMSSYTIEEVASASPGPLWFQTYLWRDHGIVRDLIERAAAANYGALVVTVDVPRSAERHRDRRNGFGLPPRLTARTLAGGLRHPRWTSDFVRRPRITAANVTDGPAGGDAVSVAGYVDRQFDPAATWDDLAWLRDAWDGPLVVKGLLDPADARIAVEHGADAVVVSNHGGRQLDHACSSIGALPAVVDAVGDEVEVYLDGGIRRGSDVVKALGMGARACLVGRPIVFGLGAAGASGAARSIEILQQELRAALMLLGAPSVRDIARDQVLAPRLGGAPAAP